MFKYQLLTREQINDDRWNATVLGDSHFRHYALTYYLDYATTDWSGLVGEDYQWVWPLPTKRVPLNRVVQPLLTQQLGPYGLTLDDNTFTEIWKRINKTHRKVRIKFNDKYQTLPFPSTNHVNVELALEGTADQMHSNYNRNVQGNLNKATKAAVSIMLETAFDPWALETFKKGRGKGIQVLNDAFFTSVEEIYCAFEKRGEACIYSALSAGTKVAQVMLLTTQDRLLLFFSASNEMARNVGAMHAILDRIISDHSGSDKVLDFEGSDNAQLAFFYKSFGGSEKIYLQAEEDRLIWPLNQLLK
ncbi:MAG: hypothetical protein HQ500_03795 [Flavobacteriales bacterium]|nr:hypothetical protein [Flavobacteriales bacterium]